MVTGQSGQVRLLAELPSFHNGYIYPYVTLYTLNTYNV